MTVDLRYIVERRPGEAILRVVEGGHHSEHPLTRNQLYQMALKAIEILRHQDNDRVRASKKHDIRTGDSTRHGVVGDAVDERRA